MDLAFRGRRRLALRAAAVITFCLLMVGCAQSSGPTRPAPAPSVGSVADLATHTLPTGTVLPDGFVVAENSALVGAVFPVLLTQGPSAQRIRPLSGWTAQMLVLADPIGVFNDYIRQARVLGYETRGGCQVSTAKVRSIPLADYRGADARLVTCTGEYYRSSNRNPIDFTRVAVELYFGEIAGLPASTVNLTHTQGGDGSGDPTRYQYGPPLGEITDPLPPLTVVEVPELPTAGEPIAPLLSQRSDDLVVPAGSTLAALPTRGTRCTTGWDAILLTTDVEAVLTDLEKQIAPIAEEPITRSQEQRGDLAITSFTVDPAGDDRIVVTAVADVATATVLVGAC